MNNFLLGSEHPALLMDAAAIASYIDDCSTEYVDSELVEDFFFDCGAVLQQVRLDSLKEGNPDGNIACAEKAQKYSELSLETSPPIVISDGIVMDGNHRFRDALARGATMIWCYVAVELPDPRFELAQRRPRP